MRSKFKFVIGDIQGCYKEFKALLKLIDPKKENKVFCVGDLVNRGPDSEKVVDFILENNIKRNPAYWLWSHRRWKHQQK